MRTAANPPISLNKKLVQSLKKENIITKSELTWLTDEFRKQGSNITHRVIADLFYLEHICPAIYQKEVDLITEYFESKRTMIRKFNVKLQNLKS